MKKVLQLCLVIVLAGIGYAGYEYYEFQSTEVVEMEGQRAQLDSSIRKKQDEVKRLQEFARNIETIKIELRELNTQLESALEHMPRQFNLSGLLRRLSMLAQNSGLELSTFKPAAAEERQEGAFYSTLGIDCTFKGTFTQVLLFLDQVSRLKRIINADELKLSGSPNVKGQTAILNVTARMKTFRFSE